MKVTQVIAFNSKKSGLYDYANLYASNSKDILVLSECDESGFRGRSSVLHRVRLLRDILGEAQLVHVIDNTPRTFLFMVYALLLITEKRFLVTLHDPKEHKAIGLKNVLRRRFKNILNILLVALTYTNRKLTIHFHEECHLFKWCKRYIVFPHPSYRSNLARNAGADSKLEGKLTIGWFGRASYNKGYDIFCDVVKSLEGEVDIDFIACGIDEDSLIVSPNLKNYSGYLDEEAFDSLFVDVDLVLLPYRDVTSSGILAKCVSFGVPWLASKSFQDQYQCGLSINPKTEEFINIVKTLSDDAYYLNNHIRECMKIANTSRCVNGKDLYARL